MIVKSFVFFALIFNSWTYGAVEGGNVDMKGSLHGYIDTDFQKYDVNCIVQAFGERQSKYYSFQSDSDCKHH
jgi:hypothetical protein